MVIVPKPAPSGVLATPRALVDSLRNCRTTRDYIDLGLDCADQALRLPRGVLRWVWLDGWVPQLGRHAGVAPHERKRLSIMDQVEHFEAKLVDCENELLRFRQCEDNLLARAKDCHAAGDVHSVKRLYEEIRTCRHQQELAEERRTRLRSLQQELWCEAHALQDVEEQQAALQTLESLREDAEQRKAQAGRLQEVLTHQQLVREEIAAQVMPADDVTEFAAFCDGLEQAAPVSPRAIQTGLVSPSIAS